DLIVTHHPLPFLPLKQLTTDTTTGRMLLELIAARIAVYSPHTAFDSARAGINQRLAQGLQLRDVLPLVVGDDDLGAGDLGAGRWGRLSEPLALDQLADRTKQFLRIEHLHAVGDPERPVRTVAVACGSAGSFLEDALGAGCDCLLTGETQFHTYLEAKARGIALLLPGHFASERFAVECLADVLSEQFTDLTVWASQAERDPVRWV
ncbi:MAG: Nif3-like dinuclear metal center hexameric protein, partial [Planctomycetes bacterium]|nr:Nif3-like dinuclear metal center hexameric protein [Planctomycetota bacterium]